MDYIIKVDQKSKKEKDESIVYLIINKDGENAMPKFDAADIEQAKAFLNNLEPDVVAAGLELQIKDQEDVVSKAEKKLRGLKDDKEDMEKKIKKLQDDIQKNLKDQDNTQKDIENQRQELENLKLKRKPVDKSL
jgi:peptidoglycan hydrolase CwlO-like protein